MLLFKLQNFVLTFPCSLFHGFIIQLKMQTLIIVSWLKPPNTRRTSGFLHNTGGPASALIMFCFMGQTKSVCWPSLAPRTRVWHLCSKGSRAHVHSSFKLIGSCWNRRRASFVWSLVHLPTGDGVMTEKQKEKEEDSDLTETKWETERGFCQGGG